MLVELSVVEQRYLAVREALDTGATITDVARRYGVDRRTVHRWLLRYAAGGLGALADRSSRPDRCPHQTTPEVEARIVALRRSNPGWGPRTILSRLRRELETPPSRSAIYRCLLRHRLIAPRPRRRRREDYKRWERSRPMELWQIDVMGGVRLTDGTQLSVITGIDDHSRFCVMAKVVSRATARPVCDALIEGLSRHGVPEQILTDNGKVFTGKLGRKPAGVLFDRICLNNGIRHLLTAPYSPTTTGKIERLHKTMRKEFLAQRAFGSIGQAQQELDRWVSHYNHHREHQAIGDVAPIRRFELAENKACDIVDGEVEIEPVPQERPRVVVRRVDQAGRISILKHRYHVGRYLAGEQVAVESRDGLLHVTPQRRGDRHPRQTPPLGPRRQDGPPSRSLQAGHTDEGSRGLAEGRRERLRELRRLRLPGGQPLPRPDRGRSPRRGHGADHARRRTTADSSSSTRKDQGVRCSGHPERTTPEGSRCRIATGAKWGHGYRDLT
jgi:transposase InsO family protein